MTRPTALVVLFALAGCAAPHPFDAAEWMVRARDYANDINGTDEEERAVAERVLSAELDAAVGWTRACDTYWDAEAQREVYEPTEPVGGHHVRGTYTVYDIGPGEAVVDIACDLGVYQGPHVLVHIQQRRVALLNGLGVGMEGEPYGPPSAVYTTPYFEGGPRSFATFEKARGSGDCGMLARYRIAAFGEADLVEARARECDGRPEDAPPAEAWPVVYPRP